MNKFYTLLFCASASFGQGLSDMNEADMNSMMAQMQSMQACMSQVDFSSLAALQEKSFSVQKQIDTLCSSGKRDEAQEKAIDFTKEIFSLPAVLALKECTKGSPMEKMMSMQADDFNNKHVCEGEKTNFGLPSNQRIQW